MNILSATRGPLRLFRLLIVSILLLGTSLATGLWPVHAQSTPKAAGADGKTISTHIYFKDTSAIRKIIDSAIAIKEEDIGSAIAMLEQTTTASAEQKFTAGLSASLAHLSTLYANKGRFTESVALMEKMIRYCNNNKLYPVLPTVYNIQANLMQVKGNYDSASFYFYETIRIAESHPEYGVDLAGVYANLSNVLIIIEAYDKALHYLDIAEEKAKRENKYHLLTMALLNKGNVYTNMRNWTMADSFLSQGLQLARKYKYKQWEYLALTSIGNLNFLQLRYKEAIPYLKEALATKGDINPSYANATVTILGKTYYYAGDLPQAEVYLKKALQRATELGIVRDIQENDKILAYLYAQTGDFERAFKHHYAYTLLKDSLLNEENIQHNNMLEVKYRTAQKDKELTEKKLQISRQKTQIKEKNLWIVGISSGALLLAAITALLYSLYRSNWHQKRFQEEKFRNLEQEQEIGQLRAMMKGEEKERIRIAQDLHDGIGGMLASIKMNLSAIQEEKAVLELVPAFTRISGMLAETVTEVRKTAHNLMPDALTKQSLREALLIYCDNNSNGILRVDLQYGIPKVLNKAAELFIYRIAQELIQNIVKHSGASYAVIQLLLHENSLSITVEDNGTGFDTDLPLKGLGLQHIRKRVATLQGYLSLSSGKGKGTTVHIEFDFIRLENL